MTNPTAITNRASFAQILLLELRENCKESVLRVIEKLEQLDKVLAAEPCYSFVAVDLHTINDPHFNHQWGLRGANGIQAQQAWTITRGETNPRIRVGIFEDGVDASHPDLRVIPGNKTSGAAAHGTHVGGIIGSIHNNVGIAGIAQVELALLERGSSVGAQSHLFVESLVWAINNNIRIVNASFGFLLNGQDAPPTVAHREAIHAFGNSGGLLVASAGNQGRNAFGNTDMFPQFPAGYGDARFFPEITNVISVGAINENGTRWYRSSFGQNSVHIYAPGSNILSTVPRGNTPSGYRRHADGYAFADGTSMAAPHVAGVAALLRSINPNLTATQLRNAILNSAVTVTISTPMGNQNVRRLDAFNAILASTPITISNTTIDLHNLYVINGTTLTLRNVTVNNPTNNSNFGFEVRGGGRLIIENSTINLRNGRLIAVGAGSRVEMTGAHPHELFIVDGRIAIGSGARMVVTNGNVRSNGVNSVIEVNGGDALNFNNRSTFHMNGGRLNLVGGSVSINNQSSWSTLNMVNIVGLMRTDRINISQSTINFCANTRISRSTAMNWDGIFFTNCIANGTTIFYSRLRGNISGISYINISSSNVIVEHANIHQIGEMRISTSCRVYIIDSQYSNNNFGITATSSLVITDRLTVSHNGCTGILVLFSSADNRISRTDIFNNSGAGLYIVNSFVQTNLVNIRRNIGSGGIDVSSTIRPVLLGTEISLNGGAEVISDNHLGFPRFGLGTGNLLSEIPINSSPAPYFVIRTNFTGVVDAGTLIIDDSNPAKFRPSRAHYRINGRSSSSALALHNMAMMAIADSSYTEAKEIMLSIIDRYPETIEAISAVGSLPYLNTWIAGDVDELFSYLESIRDDNLQNIRLETMAITRMFNGEHHEAVELFGMILNNPPSASAEKIAEMNQAYSFMRLAESGSDRLPQNVRRQPRTYEDFMRVQREIREEISELRYNEHDETEPEPELELEEELVFASNIFPNPFNPETTISFTLPESGNVSIEIFNIRGQRVRTLVNGNKERGRHSLTWNGTDDFGRSAGSGVYLYRIIAGENTHTGRMMLLK